MIRIKILVLKNNLDCGVLKALIRSALLRNGSIFNRITENLLNLKINSQ